MKLSNFFIPTLKENPSDAIIPSHKLMVRAGMIRQLTAGVYSYLPLGWTVFKKVENIIREEMNKIGGNEFFLPALSPLELWELSGRIEDYKDIMFRISDRALALSPTHEEIFTSIAKPNLVSYKDLPKIWYQIQMKFRNEMRPRSGVLRTRQFIMKDSYSFDADMKGLDVSYNKHFEAYKNIFKRCGLKFFSVSAFSGAMGGSESVEFMIESESGEDDVVINEDISYASNLQVAVSFKEKIGRKNSNLKYEEFHTPGVKTIDELALFLKIKDKSRLAKSRIFVNSKKINDKDIKNEYILTLVCGDDEVNESKLQNIAGVGLRPARPDELLEITGADAGSIGPIGMRNDVRIIADITLEDANELISGANKNNYHFRNIDLKRDVKTVEYYDIRIVKQGELTLDKKSKLRLTKAIELGHIFKLGSKYAEALGAKYLDENGQAKPFVMGSYGIGIERIVASYIEQNHDEKGIVWSGEIAPFQALLICVNTKSLEIKNLSDNLYKELKAKNLEILYDDRDDISAGFKFNDADLIGIPLQLIVSDKNYRNDVIELKFRKTGERHKLKISEVSKKIVEYIKK